MLSTAYDYTRIYTGPMTGMTTLLFALPVRIARYTYATHILFDKSGTNEMQCIFFAHNSLAYHSFASDLYARRMSCGDDFRSIRNISYGSPNS